MKRKSKESFIDAYTVTSGRVVIFWYGRKEAARGYQCYTVKFPQSALYRYLRLQRKGNSSIGWVMLWSTPDAQTSSTLAHTPAVFLSEKV